MNLFALPTQSREAISMALDSTASAAMRHELTRVMASVSFSAAEQQRKLLRWLVEHTIEGREEDFSQYAIATEALDCRPDFNDISNSRVRTAVGRLRTRLTEYYESEGRLNRHRIVFAKGQFRARLVAAEESLSSVSKPVAVPSKRSPTLAVVVLPFQAIDFRDNQYVCAGLTLSLMRALAASGQVRIVPWKTAEWITAKTGDKREYHSATGADVILESLVQKSAGGRLTISVEWIDGVTGLLDTFIEVRGGSVDSLNLIHDLALQIAHRLQVTYDEQSRTQLAMRHSNDPAATAFYLRARESVLSYTPQGVNRAFRFVEKALTRDPYFAAAHSLLAEAHLAVGEAGIGPAALSAPLARVSAEKALELAPELGDALAARGAIELTYEWDIPRAAETIEIACRDNLAEGAPQWPPVLDLSRGKPEAAAFKGEDWARLDPGSAAKSKLASCLTFHAGNFEGAKRWALRALELDPQSYRASSLLALSMAECHQFEDSLRVASSLRDAIPDSAEANLLLAGVLGYAGKRAEAWRVMKDWRRRSPEVYVSPLMLTMAYAHMGEPSLAIESFHGAIQERNSSCLYARDMPVLSPLFGLAEFERMLNDAGLSRSFSSS